MSNIARGDELTELNQRLSVTRPWGAYGWVKVLVMYWEEQPQDQAVGFQSEARDVAQLFRELFKYNVDEFIIPKTCSTRRTRQCVLTVLNECEEFHATGKGPCLLIIHYGGHGDRDDDHHQGQERRAVWAASAAGDSETVEWHAIQEEFKDVSTDVLLLLDCCFAAQAARERDTARGRIEMLAAAAMGVKTRLPGPRSFTHALLQTIADHVKNSGEVSVSTVATDLSQRTLNLETPVHLALRRGLVDKSIRLTPLSSERVVRNGEESFASSIRLLIRATTNLKLDEIVYWLRSDLPSDISLLQAEEIIRTTNAIHNIVEDVAANRGATIHSLPPADVQGLVTSWISVPHLLEQMSQGKHAADLSQNSTPTQGRMKMLLQDLMHRNLAFINKLEQKILQQSQLNSNETLEDLAGDYRLQVLGIADQLRLRRIVSDDAVTRTEPQSPVNNGHDKVRLTSRVEFKDYGQKLDPADFPVVEHRVRMLVELLRARKSSTFRALECARWEHEPEHHRFRLEFDVPKIYHMTDGTFSSITLSEAIQQLSGRRRANLGQRFAMARTLGQAVGKWHDLGWVHQSISSANIVLFYKPDGEIDYDALYLQGFDFARPNQLPSVGSRVDNVDFNVYRHPSRQGPARQGHKKVHDIYSFGVVLLEIGLWEVASRTTKSSKGGHNLTVEAMQIKLREAATNRLPHYAGTDYQEVVSCCLEGDFGVDMDDSAESRLAQAFQTRVTDKLSKTSMFY